LYSKGIFLLQPDKRWNKTSIGLIAALLPLQFASVARFAEMMGGGGWSSIHGFGTGPWWRSTGLTHKSIGI